MASDQLNVNDAIEFRLTPEGEQACAAFWARLNLSPIPSTPDADGWQRMQLWSWAQMYGDAMYCGGPVLFVDNVVRIVRTPSPSPLIDVAEVERENKAAREVARGWDDIGGGDALTQTVQQLCDTIDRLLVVIDQLASGEKV